MNAKNKDKIFMREREVVVTSASKQNPGNMESV